MPAKRCSTKSRIDRGQGSDDNARDVSRRLAAQSAVKFQMMFCRHLLPGQSRSGPGTQFMLSRTLSIIVVDTVDTCLLDPPFDLISYTTLLMRRAWNRMMDPFCISSPAGVFFSLFHCRTRPGA